VQRIRDGDDRQHGVGPNHSSKFLVLSLNTKAFRKVARRNLSPAGPGWAEWDIPLTDLKGAPLANGLYETVYEAEGKREILKLVLVR